MKAFAHGGTALPLLNIKDSTKDVDFTFIDKDEFYSIVGVLKTMNYNPTRDFKTG
ncbi:MAG: hypothetical protein KIY11_08280 [Thermoplasmata archaeon]|nr:hypothetical protein [Candidatus Sysuiplasma acidicola]